MQLTQRFVDRRTSALMKRLKQKDELYAEIAEDGALHVEKHFVGRLQGFRFFPDTQAEGIHGKATRNAAAHVLARELDMRVRRVVSAKSEAFKLSRSGQMSGASRRSPGWRPATIRSSPSSSSLPTSTSRARTRRRCRGGSTPGWPSRSPSG